MLCTILRSVYGRDTRAAQMVNVFMSSVWAVLLILHNHGCIILDIPVMINNGIASVTVVAMLAVVFSALGFFTTGKQHQLFKGFGLSLGAVFYGILTNGYVSIYPPLDMMLVVCLSISLWFTGGLLYIMKCEGLDGTHAVKS